MQQDTPVAWTPQYRFQGLQQHARRISEILVSVTKTWSAYKLAYQVVVVLEVCFLLLHGSEDGLEGRHEIVKDDGAPLLALRFIEATRMYNSHLLQHRGFAALSSTCR